jgi:rhodanese-related sulfurtransferase
MEEDTMPAITLTSKPHFSAVLSVPAADPEDAYQHFASKFAYETDVADLMADLNKGNQDIVVIDTRSPKSFSECRIPGAVNLPKITPEATAQLAKDKVYVVYCWGPACNGATKGAMQLAQLGFHAKELLGGIEYWRAEGGNVEGKLGTDAPLFWSIGA